MVRSRYVYCNATEFVQQPTHEVYGQIHGIWKQFDMKNDWFLMLLYRVFSTMDLLLSSSNLRSFRSGVITSFAPRR